MAKSNKSSQTVHIRRMNYEDIPQLCKLSGDESEGNYEYLKRQLDNQENEECI